MKYSIGKPKILTLFGFNTIFSMAFVAGTIVPVAWLNEFPDAAVPYEVAARLLIATSLLSFLLFLLLLLHSRITHEMLVADSVELGMLRHARDSILTNSTALEAETLQTLEESYKATTDNDQIFLANYGRPRPNLRAGKGSADA